MVYSPAFSFTGWDILEFLKGRKKMVVTVIAGIIGYAVLDSAAAAAIAAAVVEAGFAIAEYYVKPAKR